jgi:hypothetical protein
LYESQGLEAPEEEQLTELLSATAFAARAYGKIWV